MDNPLSGGGGGPDLFSKIGPLPAWAWGAGVVGAYILWSHHTAPPAAVDNTVDGAADNMDTGTADTSGDSTVPPLDPSQAGYNFGDVNSGYYGGTVAGSTFTSNQQWSVYVIGALVKDFSYPAAKVSTAITYYLAGKQLTPDEVNIVQAAITNYGPPPLPMPVNTVPTTPAGAPAAPKLTGANGPKTTVVLNWQAVGHAASYIVTRDRMLVGTTRRTSWSSGSLKKGSRHSFRVRAVGSNGKIGPYSNEVTVTIR